MRVSFGVGNRPPALHEFAQTADLAVSQIGGFGGRKVQTAGSKGDRRKPVPRTMRKLRYMAS